MPEKINLIKKIKNLLNRKNSEQPIAEDTKHLPKILENFLSNKSIHEVSIPRAKMDCVQENDKLESVIKTVVKTGRSRFPVIKEHFEVSGFLYVKDIFKHIGEVSSKKVKDIMHPPIKISYTSRIQDVLHNMRQSKKHMAIIVNEYGDVDGVVTMEDIVEELVGEIEDEFDYSKPEYQKVKDGIIIDSDMSLKIFNKLFKFNFEEEGVDTIGGYICFSANKIPKKNEVITLDEKSKVIILEANKKQIKKIKLLNTTINN